MPERYDAARRSVDGIAERAAAALVEQLEQGQAPTAPTPMRAATENAEAAKTELEHALAAQDDVMALVGPAALTVERAEDRVKEAARGVIRLRIGDLRSEIDTLTARAGALRLQLNSLMPTLIDRPWLTPWPTEAAALLDDPEAVLGDEVT